MDVPTLIAHYGLVAIAIGAAVEGEPFAIAGGLMAHHGLASLPAAIATSIGGAIAVDQGWFFVARHFREQRWVRAIRRRPAFATALGWLRRHPTPFVLLFRFAYGLRAVAPVAIGASGVPTRTYVPLTLLAAIVWGTAFTLLGYAFGHSLDGWLAGRPLVRALLYAIPLIAFVLVPVLTFRKGHGSATEGRPS